MVKNLWFFIDYCEIFSNITIDYRTLSQYTLYSNKLPSESLIKDVLLKIMHCAIYYDSYYGDSLQITLFG